MWFVVPVPHLCHPEPERVIPTASLLQLPQRATRNLVMDKQPLGVQQNLARRRQTVRAMLEREMCCVHEHMSGGNMECH